MAKLRTTCVQSTAGIEMGGSLETISPHGSKEREDVNENPDLTCLSHKVRFSGVGVTKILFLVDA